jgi:hypothetical protein
MTVWLASVLLLGASATAQPRAIDFNRDIRPLLSKHCYACHGPDDAQRQAELRLDRRDAALAVLESGATPVVPGDSSKSELYRRVTSADADERMPPADSGHALSAAELELLRRWIDEGAKYAEHWSHVPPVRPELPPVKDAVWPRRGLDYFVLARIEQAGLRPSLEADRYQILRRVSLDLRGLPPSLEEIEAFVADERPDAYERLVDRLLADSAYGERWARMWLDLARYADSAGYGSDPVRTIWRYRDWVIDALNRNLPYDRFTIEQLAGDLLPEPAFEQQAATAFHRNTMTNTEGGTDDEEFRVAAIKDRVDTTLQVWMGMTAGCAKCHNHKYDPISQAEYYRLFAYFNQTADADRPDESPTLEVPQPEVAAEIARIDAQVAELKQQLAAAEGEAKKPLEEQIAKLEKSKPKQPTVPVMRELPPDKRRSTHVLIKGSFLNPGERVEPGVPTALHSFPDGAPANRLGLAQWVVDRRNPLTARVAVNRYWAQLFGVGLVETEEDFGTQGELPSHPELLDWLAVEFMQGGWDMKRLLREIVTSATYRQTSRRSGIRENSDGLDHLPLSSAAHGQPRSGIRENSAPPTPIEVRNGRLAPAEFSRIPLPDADPQNRLFSRGPRFRLEAETVRDQALALAGLLSRKQHGPSVFPPQPPGLWQAAFNGKDRTWATSQGEDRHRRGIYTFWRRTVPYPSMSTFDAPSREICSVRRIRTNTPLQAFVTLNDPVYVEAAQALARQLVREGGSTPRDRARYGLRLCLARPPHDEQVADLVSLYESELAHYRADPTAALALATEPLGPLPEGLDAAELAAWTVVANVLLNLDGVLTKG